MIKDHYVEIVMLRYMEPAADPSALCCQHLAGMFGPKTASSIMIPESSVGWTPYSVIKTTAPQLARSQTGCFAGRRKCK